MDPHVPFSDLNVDYSQPGQNNCLTTSRQKPSLRSSCNLPDRALVKNGQFLHCTAEADPPWRRAVSSQSPSLGKSDSIEDSNPSDNGTDETPIGLAPLQQELDSIVESRAAQISYLQHRHHRHNQHQHHHRCSCCSDNANGSSTLLISAINPTGSDAEVENILEEYGGLQACELERSFTATVQIRTPEQALAIKEALGLDSDGWTLQVGDRPRSSRANPTDIMGGLWFARLSQDDVVSPPFVPPTDLSDLDFHHCPGLAGSSEPPKSTYYQNSQDLRSSEAPSAEPVVGGYLRRQYQLRRTLSPHTYEKVCKRRGIRKPADECHRGREYRRSLLIRSDRDSSHNGHRRSKAKRGPASLQGVNLVGSDIDDRLHAYALPNDDQPNITQQNSLKGDQLNAQSLVRSKIPYDDDPYDAQDSVLTSPLSSSGSRSDTEVGQNEKMVWMVMPNGFPGVAPPTM